MEDNILQAPSIAAPIGASWSEQRQALQLKLSVKDAEDTLHPVLVHDVQRNLIDYLQQMQQSQDGANQSLKYYIPSETALESRSQAMLSHAMQQQAAT